MLTRFKLHNFRSYLNAEIEFRQRHLLIGPNNSGKTNLMLGLQFLAATSFMKLDQLAGSIPGGVGSLQHYGFDGKVTEFELHVSLDHESGKVDFVYKLEIELGNPATGAPSGFQTPRVNIISEELTAIGGLFGSTTTLLKSDGKRAWLRQEDAKPDAKDDTLKEAVPPANETVLSKLYDLPPGSPGDLFRKYLGSFMYLSISPTKARWTWMDQKATFATLGQHAENLPFMIYHLKNQDEARYRRMIAHVQQLEPDLEAINFFVTPDQQITPFLVMRVNRKVGWATLSDGTLRYLALAYIIEASDTVAELPDWPAPLVMIEEPENGIYVGQLRRLLDAFEERTPHGQFIFASHSPYLIDLFDNDLDAVSLLAKARDRTTITPLGQKRTEIVKALEQMSLGEQYFRRTFFDD